MNDSPKEMEIKGLLQAMNIPERIPVAGPSISEREIAYVNDAVRYGWYGNANVYLERFEKAMAAYVGRRYAIALPHCTAGLHLALVAAGVKPGDEVIVPDATWIASAAPVSYVGAAPIFADVDPDSWCLTADSVAKVITPRTKAIIAVDLYGSMPDFDALTALAQKHGIALIEDAAEAVGSEFHGRKAGAFGICSTFSFHGSKTFSTGEGGMLTCDDTDFHRRCLQMRDHGRIPGDTNFYNLEVGFKYRMSGVVAALGLAQVERAEELIARKRAIYSWYAEELGGIGGVTLNAEPQGTRNSYWMVTPILDPNLGIRKEALIARLRERGVDSRPFFHPLSSIPAYEKAQDMLRARDANNVSYRLGAYGINLPSGYNMTREIVMRVADAFRDSLKMGPQAR